MNDRMRQKVLGLLDEGYAIKAVARLFGEGKLTTIRKLKHQLDSGEIVLSGDKYLSVETAQKRDINFSGQSAEAEAAKGVIVHVNKATVDEATIMTGNKLDVGQWAINTYTAVAAKYSKDPGAVPRRGRELLAGIPLERGHLLPQIEGGEGV